jgi:hypothetical protein
MNTTSTQAQRLADDIEAHRLDDIADRSDITWYVDEARAEGHDETTCDAAWIILADRLQSRLGF